MIPEKTLQNNKQVKKLITHNGSFHTDDIFATVTLSLILERQNEEFEVIRTRDPEIIKNADYVYDVGGVYDADSNRFDHHQVGGAGQGASGIEYSSFGLVWQKFGKEICGSQKVADIINKKLVSPVDAWDNGMDLVENKYNVTPYYMQHSFLAMCPTWQEKNLSHDEMFFESVKIARVILLREIQHAKDFMLAEDSVREIYKSAEDKRIIVLDKNYPYGHILNDFPEPLFVIYPRETDNTWGAKAVHKESKSFKNRKDFPAGWGGLQGVELQKITGVPDAVFCHRALFLAVAKSKEGVIKLAELALQ